MSKIFYFLFVCLIASYGNTAFEFKEETISQEPETLAMPLFKQTMNQDERDLIVSAIDQISNEHRLAVLGRVMPLLTEHMGGDEIKAMIDAVRNVVASQQYDILDRSLPFFTLPMSGIERGEVIFAILSIASDQRDDVLARAWPFCAGDITGQGKADIIVEVAITDAHRRDYVLGVTSRLIIPEMNGEERAHIISIIRDFPFPVHLGIALDEVLRRFRIASSRGEIQNSQQATQMIQAFFDDIQRRMIIAHNPPILRGAN